MAAWKARSLRVSPTPEQLSVATFIGVKAYYSPSSRPSSLVPPSPICSPPILRLTRLSFVDIRTAPSESMQTVIH